MVVPLEGGMTVAAHTDDVEGIVPSFDLVLGEGELEHFDGFVAESYATIRRVDVESSYFQVLSGLGVWRLVAEGFVVDFAECFEDLSPDASGIKFLAPPRFHLS